MSRIVVSFSDKGREHLFRALAIIELLADHHDLLVVVPASLYRLTTELCPKHDNVELFVASPTHENSCLKTHEGSECRPPASAWTNFSWTENKIQRYAPDLLISGSESLLPRISKKLGVRCIRVDYQHIFNDIDLRAIPLASRLPLMISNFARSVLSPRVDQQFVSSFHPYPRRKFGNVRHRKPYTRVGVLLRNELQMPRSHEPHLLVKIAEQNRHWLTELAKIKLPAMIYGLGNSEKIGSLQFKNSPQSFAEDLLSCSGVVTDVGNQLIGEALACGKHVLAVPDASNYQQRISALFISQCHLTGTVVAPMLTADVLTNFYDSSLSPNPQTVAVPMANDEMKSLIELQLSDP